MIKSVFAFSSVFADPQFLKKHPKVQANANRVKLEVRGNNAYYGHLYVGENYEENRIIFDTMS